MSSPVMTRPQCGEHRQTPGEIIPLLTSIDYCVNHAVSVKKFSSVGPFGKFFTDDLLRYAGAREADESSRFRDDDIAQIRE
jgi:hypothetical protein